MQIKDIITVKIEKVLYEGVGLSHYDNLAVFVENACDEDILKIEITSVNKKFARGKIVEIIEPSKYRIKSFCNMSNVCGGCQFCFIDYKHQLEIKRNIVKEALSNVLENNIEVKEIIPSPKTVNFRHKIQLPVSQTKNSKRFLIGYYKPKTHEIVNIKHCEIQPEYINEITDFIREKAKELNISAYNEKKHKGDLRHIIFKCSKHYKNCLLIFVINNKKIPQEFLKLAQLIKEEFKEVTGIIANFNDKKTNSIIGNSSENITGENFYKEKIGEKDYLISAESFFQTNPYTTYEILELVKSLINKRIKNPTILDAYSGVSTFGIYLSDIAKEITCVEEVQSATNDAQESIKLNKINNITIINDDAQKVFEQFSKERNKFDVIILDPPRKGSSKETLDYANMMCKKLIVYVSCNPMTLARDAQILKEKGFKIKYVQPVDMFCHSYHIETVALFEK